MTGQLNAIQPPNANGASIRLGAVIGLRELRSAWQAGASAPEPQLQAPLDALRRALQAEAAILYIPEPGPHGWEFGTCEWAGRSAPEHRQQLLRFLREAGARGAAFGAFDPYAVTAQQRNRALTASELTLLAPAAGGCDRLRASLHLQRCDQVRALVCDGPRLLAWVGALRERAFERSDVELLQSIVESLRAGLLQVRERAGVPRALVEGLLDTFREATFVLCEHGRVEFANRAGNDWLEQPDAARDLTTLRAAIRGRRACPAFSWQELRVGDASPFRLARQLNAQGGTAGVIARAESHFLLRDRDRSVLPHLLSGRSNKEIAAELHCSEVTIERRMTHLFEVTGTHSRMELVARLHAL